MYSNNISDCKCCDTQYLQINMSTHGLKAQMYVAWKILDLFSNRATDCVTNSNIIQTYTLSKY